MADIDELLRSILLGVGEVKQYIDPDTGQLKSGALHEELTEVDSKLWSIAEWVKEGPNESEPEPPEDQEAEFAQALAQCRAYGHNWRYLTARNLPSDHPHVGRIIGVHSECERCGMNRKRWADDMDQDYGTAWGGPDIAWPPMPADKRPIKEVKQP